MWRKLGSRKSRLETNTENEASSALIARLWCYLPLQNPANRAENLIRLCSATIGRTGWRMVQSGAIRSRLLREDSRVRPRRDEPAAIARSEGFACNTVARWLEKAADVCRRFNHGMISSDSQSRSLQADESRCYLSPSSTIASSSASELNRIPSTRGSSFTPNSFGTHPVVLRKKSIQC